MEGDWWHPTNRPKRNHSGTVVSQSATLCVPRPGTVPSQWAGTVTTSQPSVPALNSSSL